MIAVDAIHDACERYPPPNVHQGTRTRILEVLTAWINDLDSQCQSFWLHGPAGSGKSAILQALAEVLSSPKGPVAGSFFFGRGQSKRGTGDYLFPTLAYQLAVNVKGLRPYVDEVMQGDPTLPTKSMEVQLRTLIIEPFQRLETFPSNIHTVIIDGLDECQEEKTQESILQLIGDALIEHKLPLRFLIASRPEPHIRDGFDSHGLLSVSKRLMLHDDFQTQNDIEKYLQDGFADICRNSRSMIHVKIPWPGKDVIDTLTRHACGQFIYAATVLKFVAQKSTHPIRQLDIVLRPHPSRAKAFSELDCLYSQILSTHPDPDTLVRVLSIILAFKSPQPAIVIEETLEMEKGEILAVLEGLHSLLKISKSYIRNRHASFRDYLLDSSRSGVFYIDGTTLDAHLSTSIFSMTSKWILKSSRTTTFKARNDISYEPDFQTRDYISRYLVTHLRNVNSCVGLHRVAAEFKEQIVDRAEVASIVPFEIIYSLIEPLSVRQHCYSQFCKGTNQVLIHVCYRSVLSSVASLPILGVVEGFLPFDTLESICRLEGSVFPEF
jgi:energy-coupling factor transporter ATP-binding protein EcfA2